MPRRPRLRLLDKFWDFLLGDRETVAPSRRARLGMESLEGRIVPTGQTLSLNTSSVALTEGGSAGTITLSRTDSTAALTVRVGIADTSGVSHASQGLDYSIAYTNGNVPVGGGNLSFHAGQASLAFAVTPLRDNLVEPTEGFTLSLLGNPNYTVGTPGTTAVTIADDPATVWLTQDETVAPGTSGTLTLHRSGGDISKAMTGYITIADTPGFAHAYTSVDYSVYGPNGRMAFGGGGVDFAAGATTATITVNDLLSGSTGPLKAALFSVNNFHPDISRLSDTFPTSAVVELKSGDVTTSTALTSSPNAAVSGAPVTLTATVSYVGHPSGGNVTFYDGSTGLGAVNLAGSNVATLTTSGLSVGTHGLTAVYSGATGFGCSTGSLAEVVNKDAVSETLSGPTLSVVGQTIQYLANLTAMAPGAGTPGGNVTFTASLGNRTIGLGTVALAGGTAAMVPTNELAAGNYTIAANYTGDGNFSSNYTTGTLTVSAGSGPVNETTASSGCPCNGPVGGASDAAPAGAASTGSGVDASTGHVELTRTDLASSGGGTPFDENWSYTNAPGYSDGLSGTGATQTQVPHLVQVNGNSSIALVSNGKSARFFDSYGGAYHARFADSATLAQGNGTLTVNDGTGNTFTFSDFSAASGGKAGRLSSMTDAGGDVTSVTGSDSAGRPLEVQQTTGSGATAQTLSFAYTYVASGANAGLLATVAQRVSVGGGAWQAVHSAAYAYYSSGATNGTAGGLELATVLDGSGATISTAYYRYYLPGQSGDGDGTGSLLKYQFDGPAYARLTAALGTGVDALTDAQVAPYATTFLSYDAQNRVSTAVDAAAGCSVCSGGLGTFSYAYSGNANSDGLLSENEWATKTVETAPDGNQTTTYSNAFGQAILSVYKDTTTGQQWETFTRFNAAGQAVLAASPSAVSGFDEALPDLVGYGNATETFLRAGSGLVTTYGYGTATTATETAAGDVAGYAKETDLRQGVGGTAVPQSLTLYTAHTAGGSTVYREASSTRYRNADGTGAETTTTAYAFYAGTQQVYSQTTAAPAVTAAENGPGTATSTTTVFDQFGRTVWTKDEAGYLTYMQYDSLTGAVTESIADVDTTQTAEFVGLPTGWATPTGGGLNLVTSFAVDTQGRTTKAVSPAGTITYTVYDDANHEVRTYAGWDGTTQLPTGPTAVTRDDWANGYSETLTISSAPNVDASGHPQGTEALSGLQSLSRTYVNAAGQAVRTDAYFNLSGLTYSTGAMGTLGVNYYETLTGYDHDGRENKVVTPQGTIERTVYDGQGRAVSTWIGTHDTPTSGYWSPANLAGTDMVETSSSVYDSGGVGDGNLTQRTMFSGVAAGDPNAVTLRAYDWRDRLVGTKSGASATEADGAHRPIAVTTYDNLGEATLTQAYDGDGLSLTDGNGTLQVPAAALLRAQSAASYDELGRTYYSATYSVDATTGTAGSALSSNTWFDLRGNVVERAGPNGPVSKVAYDGAGRTTLAYVTDGAGGSSYAAASSVANDLVLSQVQKVYDGDGNVIETVASERLPNATGTGALGNATSGVLARVSYAATYYDLGDRMLASVDVGTNGGTAWTRPTARPLMSDAVLVSLLQYGADGRVMDSTDPRGIDSRTLYDALGRKVETIQDFEGVGTPTATTNKTTLYAYSASGMTGLTAVNSTGVNQTTGWVYGVTTVGGSAIDSNDVVGATEHPDPTTGAASASLEDTVTVDAEGKVLTRTDRNGTVHSYSYDSLNRQITDAVTTLGSGVDGSVMKVGTAYDGQGNAYLITSYDGTGTVVNQVEQLYNGFGQLTREYQAVTGSVSTSTTPSVQYTYSTGTNASRLTSIVYPDGYTVTDNYASGVDSTISRLTSLSDATGTLEAYTYLGLGTVVERNHPESNANLSYLTVGGTGDAGDEVTGLDRFGRVVDQRWVNGNATLSEYTYGYDRDGNRLYKQDAANGNFSQLYAYDNLNQLAGYQEGTLNANQTALTGNASANQTWGYDALGNWQSVTTNGTTQARTANAQNEYTAVGNATPAYDANGDMTTDETGKHFSYDAWNRLVIVKDSGNVTLETDSYDGGGRRATTTTAAGTVSVFYSADWQALEESFGGTYTNRYVWSPVYVDAMVLRDADASGTGLTATGGNYTRLWPMQDINWDVAVLVDNSGNAVERYDYTPFGVMTIFSPSYTVQTASSFGWQYECQGLWRDEFTGLYYARNRMYSPIQGRFITADPTGFEAGDVNLYRWEENSTLNAVDPMGTQPQQTLFPPTLLGPPGPSHPGPNKWRYELRTPPQKLSDDEVSYRVGINIIVPSARPIDTKQAWQINTTQDNWVDDKGNKGSKNGTILDVVNIMKGQDVLEDTVSYTDKTKKYSLFTRTVTKTIGYNKQGTTYVQDSANNPSKKYIEKLGEMRGMTGSLTYTYVYFNRSNCLSSSGSWFLQMLGVPSSAYKGEILVIPGLGLWANFKK